MESPIALSNYFIQKSIDSGRNDMTLMKIIKMVYISHGWYLGLSGNSLLPEAVEAWQYGPVVPTVYHEFKRYGKSPIKSLSFDPSYGAYPIVKDSQTIKFLDQIWEVYGNMDGLQLSALTHKDGTPWDIVWNKNGGKSFKSYPIANDIIEDHYKQKANVESRNK